MSLGIENVYVCGLSYDYSVGRTALDSAKYGFNTHIIKDATKSISNTTEEIMT